MLFQLRKVDAKERRVTAHLDETPDRVGEIMDYASSKPEIARWSEEMRKASGGKSLGNVRAMHQLDAVGVVEGIEFDDAGRAIELAIKVVDDDAWRKCEAGVYTGISPGGKYLKRWADGANTRYTASLGEVSLVDRPMIPSATFTMLKADGSSEERPFAPVDEHARIAHEFTTAATEEDIAAIVMSLSTQLVKVLFADDMARRFAAEHGLTKADYSDDERAAMAKSGEAEDDGSYPIKNKADLEKAVHAYGRSKDKAKTKAHIIARAKALKATDLLPEDWDGSTKKMEKVAAPAALRKGLSDVACMSGLIQNLSWVCDCMSAEAAQENDGSPLPGRLAEAIGEMAEILVALATEETRELVTALKTKIIALPTTILMQAATIGDLAKAGARHSRADKDRVQAIHDHARDLGAECGDDMAQADGARGNALAAAFTGAGLRADLKKVSDERDLLKRRVTELERQPAPGGPVLRTVERSADTGGGAAAAALSATETEERARIDKMPSGKERALEETRWAIRHPQIAPHHRTVTAQR